jgi:hypothetical protein
MREDHLCEHGDVVAKHRELGGAFCECAPPRTGALKAGQDHGVPGGRQQMAQAMAYPASRGHAGRRSDDRQRAWLVQPHRLLCAVRCVQGGEVHEARRCVRTGVLTHRRAAIDVQGCQGHGAVYVHGYRRYVAPGRQLAERVQNQLGAVHRESGMRTGPSRRTARQMAAARTSWLGTPSAG